MKLSRKLLLVILFLMSSIRKGLVTPVISCATCMEIATQPCIAKRNCNAQCNKNAKQNFDSLSNATNAMRKSLNIHFHFGSLPVYSSLGSKCVRFLPINSPNGAMLSLVMSHSSTLSPSPPPPPKKSSSSSLPQSSPAPTPESELQPWLKSFGVEHKHLCFILYSKTRFFLQTFFLRCRKREI